LEVTRGDVDLSNTSLWQVTEGRQNLDLDGGRAGTRQAVKTGELRAIGKLMQK